MSTQSHLDLTEFVSKLIHDTFNAITVSSKEQAEAHFELTRMATLDFEAFRDRYITEEAIEDELMRRFPTDSLEHPSAIYEGAPYTAELETKIQDFAKELNVELTIPKRSKSLTAKSVQMVHDAVQNALASQHYNSFGEIIKRGIPRVIIDSGRISAKMSFKTEEIEERSTAGTPSTIYKKTLAASTFNRTLFNKRVNEKIAKTRVGVFLPDPLSSTEKTEPSLWGEVEINFKTAD
jgi:hypothetical protein